MNKITYNYFALRDKPDKSNDLLTNKLFWLQDKAYLYLFNEQIGQLDKDLTEVKIEYVWKSMNDYAEPVYGEYVELSENPAFNRVTNRLFEFLFWVGEIYILYVKESEEFFVFMKSEKLKIEKRDLKETEGVFIDVMTGEGYIIDHWEEVLLRLEWPRQDTFLRWYMACYTWLLEDIAWHKIFMLSNKRVSLLNRSNVQGSQEPREKEKKFYSTSVWIDESDPNYDFHPTSFLESSHIQIITDAIYRVRDRKLSELGRVANLNPKGDRMTTGENYKDIIGIANRQRRVLNMLKNFANDCLDMWGVELEFGLNTIIDRQANTSMDIPTADTANHLDEIQ